MTNWADTPDGMIERLDEALVRRGETIRLQRLIGTQQIPIEVECLAAPIDANSKEVSDLINGAGITQQDVFLVISPTQIDLAQWPGASAPSAGDKRIPRLGDRIIKQGRPLNVQAAKGRYPRDVLVRIAIWARGG